MSTSSAIQKLLEGLNASLSNPNQAGTMGLAQGLLAASAPHMLTPVSMGQAMGMGEAASQQYQHAALQNAIQREAMLPFQVARTKEFRQALANQNNPNLTPQQRADNASIGLQFAGIKPNEVPGIAGQIARQQTLNQFHTLGPNARGYGPPLSQDANAQGPLPMGSVQGPAPGTPGGPPLGSLNLSLMPGAANAIQGAAADQSYGSSQGSLPATVAAARAAPKTLGPGTTLGSMSAGNGMAPKIARMVGAGVAQGAPAPAAPQSPTGAAPSAGPGVTSGMPLAQAGLQKGAAAQTQTDEAAASKDYEVAQTQLARLAQMQTELNQIPVSGNAAKVYGDIGNFLTNFGVKIPGLAAIQEFTKGRVNFVADAARSMGAGISFNEVGFLAKGIPDFSMAGNAPRVLLAQLQGAAQYKMASTQALQYYEKNVPNPYGKAYQGTDRGFSQWWQKTGVSPGAFMFLSTMQSLPEAERSQYLSHFQSNATGRMYLNQYRKAQSFLKQNPDLVPFWSQQQ